MSQFLKKIKNKKFKKVTVLNDSKQKHKSLKISKLKQKKT